MRVSFRSVLLASGFTVVLVVFGSVRLLGTPDKGRDADTRAINDVLSAQQSAWNRGDVDAFLVGYWPSPELTFSGSSGVSRGWDGVLARYKKSYPNHAAMGQLEFSDLEFRFLGPDAALVLGQWLLQIEFMDEFGRSGQAFSTGWFSLYKISRISS